MWFYGEVFTTLLNFGGSIGGYGGDFRLYENAKGLQVIFHLLSCVMGTFTRSYNGIYDVKGNYHACSPFEGVSGS